MRQESTTLAVALASCLALAGCETTQSGYPPQGQYPASIYSDPAAASGQEGTMVHTDAARYVPGAVVRVRLTNRTGRVVSYNMCNSKLEFANSEGDWRVVAPALANACTRELRSLAPGATAGYQFKHEALQKRGNYRIRVQLLDTAGRTSIETLSNTFQVQPQRDD